jgi:HEAT repeat protein
MQRALGRAVAITALLVVLGHSVPARADNVDELIQQLRSDDSNKVRLSAAVNLAKLGNQRAIPPLVRAVIEDSDRSVRGAAAVGLGALVNDRTRPADRDEAKAALKQAKNDTDDFVRRRPGRST